jgi:hypothetical protein
MNARRICLAASALLALLQLGCGGALGLRPLENDPDPGAAATSGTGGTAGAGAGTEVGGAGGVAGAPGVAGAGAAGTAGPAGPLPPKPTCNLPPSISISPGQTRPLSAGTTAAFDLSVSETNPSPCPARTYQYSFFMRDQLSTTDPTVGVLTPVLGGGYYDYTPVATTTIHVVSATSAPPGTYIVAVEVNDASDASQAGVAAAAAYVVGVPSTGILLVPDGDGHFDGSNAAGVIGSWWATADDYGKDGVPGTGSCPQNGFSNTLCSVFTTPTPGTSFRPDPGGRGMCTSGVSAQRRTGNPADSSIWGSAIGFNPANPGTLADGTTLIGPYDAPAHGVTGFAFDIDAVPTGGQLRVAFQTVGTENNPAYWGGATSTLSPVTAQGHYEMRWAEIGGPAYVTNPPTFDPTKLTAIQFQVVSNSSAPVPFNFCVNNIMLLTN